MKNEVMNVENTAVSTEVENFNFLAQDITPDDILIPYIGIAQKLSKVLDDTSDCYNNKAKEGDLINSVTKDSLGTNIIIYPIHKKEIYEEWEGGPKNAKKIAEYTLAEYTENLNDGTFKETEDIDKNNKKIKKVTNMLSGNDINKTIKIFVIFQQTEEDKPEIGIISLKNSNINVYKLLASLLARAGKGLPKIILSTVKKKNDHGNWYNFAIALHEDKTTSDEEIKKYAMEIRNFIDSSNSNYVEACVEEV